MRRHQSKVRLMLILWVIVAACSPPSPSEGEDPNMSITFWYGDQQQFGFPGVAQKWVNILGNVSSDQGIKSLTFRLNDGAVDTLSVGSDLHRLASGGDFNIDLDTALLSNGTNTIEIYATDSMENQLSRSMTFTFESHRSWPLPYTVDWAKVTNIQRAVQVVDGHWELASEGIRNRDIYYDRVLAIGDGQWTDYQLTTSVTFHSFTPPIEGPPTYNVSHAAIASRWPGHDEDGRQPRRKWFPLGATCEFRLTTHLDSCRWRIFDGPPDRFLYREQGPESYRTIELGTTYGMKHLVLTDEQGATRYRVKLWPLDEPEPANWDFEAHEVPDNVGAGSALLLAHNTEVTFGNIYVTRPEAQP